MNRRGVCEVGGGAAGDRGEAGGVRAAVLSVGAGLPAVALPQRRPPRPAAAAQVHRGARVLQGQAARHQNRTQVRTITLTYMYHSLNICQ